MSAAADRRARQVEIEREFTEDQNERPNIAPAVFAGERCPGSFGSCDFTMKGSDGIPRCWYCCRRKPVTS